MTVLGYIIGILLIIGMGLFAICSFIIANEIDKENESQTHGHFFKYKGGDVDDQL